MQKGIEGRVDMKGGWRISVRPKGSNEPIEEVP